LGAALNAALAWAEPSKVWTVKDRVSPEAVTVYVTERLTLPVFASIEHPSPVQPTASTFAEVDAAGVTSRVPVARIVVPPFAHDTSGVTIVVLVVGVSESV